MRVTFTRPKPENQGRESPIIELKEIGTPVLLSTTATVHPEPPPLPSNEKETKAETSIKSEPPKPKQIMASDLAKALALRREAMGWDS